MDNNILNNIVNFISSDSRKLNLPMIPIDEIDDIMYKLGFLDIGDWDPNGWECNFVKSYSNNNSIIDFRGSLYYGKFIFEKR